MTSMLKPLFISVVALGALAPIASAQCDISQTKCAVNGGKCNIHFKNKTGDAGGSDGGSSLDQSSSAQTIIVKAKDDKTDRVGNKLKIVDGAKKTMNITKKSNKDGGFASISIASQDFGFAVSGADMSCEDIKAVLNGNGTCKVFHGLSNSAYGAPKAKLGFQCDGGNVAGPKS